MVNGKVQSNALTSVFVDDDSLQQVVSRGVDSFFGLSGCTKITSVRTQLSPSSPQKRRLKLGGRGAGGSSLLPAGEQERLLAASSLVLLLLLQTLLAS